MDLDPDEVPSAVDSDLAVLPRGSASSWILPPIVNIGGVVGASGGAPLVDRCQGSCHSQVSSGGLATSACAKRQGSCHSQVPFGGLATGAWEKRLGSCRAQMLSTGLATRCLETNASHGCHCKGATRTRHTGRVGPRLCCFPACSCSQAGPCSSRRADNASTGLSPAARSKDVGWSTQDALPTRWMAAPASCKNRAPACRGAGAIAAYISARGCSRRHMRRALSRRS